MEGYKQLKKVLIISKNIIVFTRLLSLYKTVQSQSDEKVVTDPY